MQYMWGRKRYRSSPSHARNTPQSINSSDFAIALNLQLNAIMNRNDETKLLTEANEAEKEARTAARTTRTASTNGNRSSDRCLYPLFKQIIRIA